MKHLLFFSLLHLTLTSPAQNVGIGTGHPVQKLDVNGAIKIGSSNTVPPSDGTIRWNADLKDFEGFNGLGWVSLTGGHHDIGNGETLTFQTGIVDPRFDDTYNGLHFSNILSASGNYLLSTAVGFSNASGAVLVYKERSGIFNRHRLLRSPTPEAQAKFGRAVAGDNNGFVVSDRSDVGVHQSAGKAYVFSNGETISLESTLLASDPQPGDDFGFGVDIDNNRVVVGAPGKTINGAPGRGKVYIYQKSGFTWALKQAISPADGGNDHRFGHSVAISGNYMAVSSPNAPVNGQAEHGKIYMYLWNSGTQLWQNTSIVTPQDGLPHDGFGYKISLEGDTMLVTEQPHSYVDSSKISRVHIFVRDGLTWKKSATFESPDGNRALSFGYDASLSGDELLIGFYEGRVHGYDSGKAFRYKLIGGKWQVKNVLTPSSFMTTRRFGNSVFHFKNFLLVGSNIADGYREQSGLIYSYEKKE